MPNYTYKLKTDPMGMVGRECPKKSCSAYFKIKSDDIYVDEDITCPNCGNKSNVKKYSTDHQIKYINSVIFHRDECPIEINKYAKTAPCTDYIEMPAKYLYTCDTCHKCFGYDDKPNYCPYCGATEEHLKEDNKCDLKENKK